VAVVIWVYAGGGQAEFGIVPFLQRHFDKSNVIFNRALPQRMKPGPRPGVIPYGATGRQFQQIVRDTIARYLEKGVDAIIVLDDLDCDDYDAKANLLRGAVTEGFAEAAKKGIAPPASVLVAFAVPEIEAWVIADWSHTFQKRHGNYHGAMRHALSSQGVDFSNVESFDCHCDTPEAYRKLSVVLQKVFNQAQYDANPNVSAIVPYSKDTDTRALLEIATAEGIARACPRFAGFWRELQVVAGKPS
jgi:hypothetical protein